MLTLAKKLVVPTLALLLSSAAFAEHVKSVGIYACACWDYATPSVTIRWLQWGRAGAVQFLLQL